MATPSIMRRLKDRVDFLPGRSEAEGLRAKQENLEQAAQRPELAKQEESAETVSPEERLHPSARYGSQPGENRIDTSAYTKPLGSVPVYDQGGDVNAAPTLSDMPLNSRPGAAPTAAAPTGPSKLKTWLETPGKPAEGPAKVVPSNETYEYHPMVSPMAAKPASGPLGSLPTYDQGGDVDVNDGKHQVAVLEQGEKVLTPGEAEKYRAEQKEEHAHPDDPITEGAPADFNGQVLPNPTNIKPKWDTEPKETERLSGGATMNTSSPPVADVFPESGREISTKSPLGNAMKSSEPESMNGRTAEAAAPQEKPLHPDTSALLDAQRAMLTKEVQDATSKGDMVAAGSAKLALLELNKKNPYGEPELNEDKFGAKNQMRPQDNQGGIPQVGAPQSGAPAGSPVAPGESLTPHKINPEEYKQKLIGLKQEQTQALASRSPEGQLQADYIQRQIDDLQKKNPWGTSGNHPGVLGKIGHVAAKIGNIAGDIVNPGVMANIPGTDMNRQVRSQALGQAITGDTENALKAAETRNAGVGKTPQEITFHDLMKNGPNGGPQVNPATQKPYTSQEAEIDSQGTGKGVDQESINSLRKETNPETNKLYTETEAQQAVLLMKAGVKPKNPKEAELQDYLKTHELQDTPKNRDLARVEVEKRNTNAKAEAALPAAEHKIRLQSQLSEANASLNQVQADALQRGKAADEFLQKENARHTLRVTQIDSAQDALDKSDTNMLAASIVPVLATMTESNEQGIKRLNPQELGRFMPKSSGDALQWFEANYDKIAAGQIPEQYRSDLRELLNNVAHEEDGQYNANKSSIDQTLRQGAVQPKVNEHGKATTTEKSKTAGEPKAMTLEEAKKAGATHIGMKDGVKHYSDANGKDLGPVPEKK